MTSPIVLLCRAATGVLLVGAAFALSACERIFGPDEVVTTAVLQDRTDYAMINVADTIPRAVPFIVKVRTVGELCTTGPKRAEVRIAGDVVEIRPYDKRPDGNDCTLMKVFPMHEVQLRLDRAGSTRIRVIGRSVDLGYAPGANAMFIERTVVVR